MKPSYLHACCCKDLGCQMQCKDKRSLKYMTAFAVLLESPASAVNAPFQNASNHQRARACPACQSGSGPALPHPHLHMGSAQHLDSMHSSLHRGISNKPGSQLSRTFDQCHRLRIRQLTSTNSVLIFAGKTAFFSNRGPMAARSRSSTCTAKVCVPGVRKS